MSNVSKDTTLSTTHDDYLRLGEPMMSDIGICYYK